jgi:hypothetical protein
MRSTDPRAFGLEMRRKVMTATQAGQQRRPVVTFEVAATSSASRETVYGVLADLSTHLQWGGEQSPDKEFKLLSLDAPKGHASVGSSFTSTGANGFKMTFHDHSVVTEAMPSSDFAFDTQSYLERQHRAAWEARFGHRYGIEPDGSGSRITYRCDVYPLNYRPWWLHPMLRPMTRRMVSRAMAKNLENLARMAETAPAG